MSLAETIRAEVWAIDPDQPVSRIVPMSEIAADSVQDRRLQTGLMSAFGTVALLLSALGIYGVMSCTVAQRTREMGIRLALGAGSASLIRLGMRQGMRLTALGLLIGAAATAGLTRFLSGMLFEVTPTDPVTFFSIVLILCAAALLATYLPGRRATGVDPLIALRSD